MTQKPTADRVVEESEALHERVRAFARGQAPESDDFERLAIDIARFQARWSPGFRRLVDAKSPGLDRLDAIPAVPSDAFRLTRVAAHPPRLDEVCFVTSGTTGSSRGTHAMRSTRTYRELSLSFGTQAARLRLAWSSRGRGAGPAARKPRRILARLHDARLHAGPRRPRARRRP